MSDEIARELEASATAAERDEARVEVARLKAELERWKGFHDMLRRENEDVNAEVARLRERERVLKQCADYWKYRQFGSLEEVTLLRAALEVYVAELRQSACEPEEGSFTSGTRTDYFRIADELEALLGHNDG